MNYRKTMEDVKKGGGAISIRRPGMMILILVLCMALIFCLPASASASAYGGGGPKGTVALKFEGNACPYLMFRLVAADGNTADFTRPERDDDDDHDDDSDDHEPWDWDGNDDGWENEGDWTGPYTFDGKQVWEDRIENYWEHAGYQSRAWRDKHRFGFTVRFSRVPIGTYYLTSVSGAGTIRVAKVAVTAGSGQAAKVSVTPLNGQVKTAKKVVLRTKASASAKVTASISKGKHLAIRGHAGRYYKVSHKGKICYALKSGLPGLRYGWKR